jgi:hypothetical protein
VYIAGYTAMKDDVGTASVIAISVNRAISWVFIDKRSSNLLCYMDSNSGDCSLFGLAKNENLRTTQLFSFI